MLESDAMNGDIVESYVMAEIKKRANTGTEVLKVFELLDRAFVPSSKGAVICMTEFRAIDRENYIVPIWMI